MTGQRILIPLDLLHGNTDTLLWAQRVAAERAICPTLVYVVEMNIAQTDRLVDRQLCAEGEFILRKLASRFLGHENAACIRVRMGRPDEEILAEAIAGQSNLILMSSPKPARWHQLFRSHTVERVSRLALCPTLVLPLSWPVIQGELQPQPAAPKPVSSSFRPGWAGA